MMRRDVRIVAHLCGPIITQSGRRMASATLRRRRVLTGRIQNAPCHDGLATQLDWDRWGGRMSARGRDYTRIHRMVLLTVLLVMNSVGSALAQGALCTTEPRRAALRSMQAEVLALAPQRLD